MAFRARGVSRSVKALALCVALLTLATLAAAVEPARACSRVPPDPWSYLERADGAFVGRLVSRRESGQGRAVLVFSVERALKGKIGDTVEVETVSSGAACGIETSVGRRIGLFLMREGGKWFGHLCWQVEPEDLLAAAALPAPNGRGPVAMLVGGSFGPARPLALDAQGRTLAYGTGKGTPRAFAVCPGARRVAEVVDSGAGYTVAIRDLPTLRLVRQQPVRVVYAEELACISADGEQLAVFLSDTGARGRLKRVTPRSATTIWRGEAFYTSFWKHLAYVQGLDRGGTTFIAVDLRTGIARKLGTVPDFGIYQLAANPAGTRLASDAYEEGCRARCARLVLIDLARRPIVARTIPMPIDFGRVLWLSNDRFVYLVKDKILVYTSHLRLSTRITHWNARSTAALGSKLFGVGQFGRLLRVQLPSSQIRVVRRLPGEPYVIASATQ